MWPFRVRPAHFHAVCHCFIWALLFFWILFRALLRLWYARSCAFLLLWRDRLYALASITYEFRSCFFRKFQKVDKKGFFAGNDLFFGFYSLKIGGGVLVPEFCPQISKTLKFGLFWGICACSGLVLQNSAAHQCTCL